MLLLIALRALDPDEFYVFAARHGFERGTFEHCARELTELRKRAYYRKQVERTPGLVRTSATQHEALDKCREEPEQTEFERSA